MKRYIPIYFSTIFVLISGCQLHAKSQSEDSSNCDLSFYLVYKDNEIIKNEVNLPEGYRIIADNSDGEANVLIVQNEPVMNISDLVEVRLISLIDEMRADYPDKQIPPKLIQHLSDQSTLTFIFDKAGAEKLKQLTTNYTNYRLAIIIKGRVWSAPVIQEPINNGEARITISKPLKESEDFVNDINRMISNCNKL